MERGDIYLGGEWVAPAGTDRLTVEEPATETTLGSVPLGTAADVDRAVAAARAAFPRWAASTRSERAEALTGLRDALVANAGEFADLITREVGTPARISAAVQAGLPPRIIDGYLEVLAGDEPGERTRTAHVVHEPVGVVGAITPWNYPLHQVVAKLAPALAAGCTIVVKPSELSPLTAYRLFDLLHELDLPPGVVNLVPGDATAGAALAAHPDLDAVSFTGSVAAGAKVAAAGAPHITRVTLELGGKSANVVLPDADLERAVKAGINDAFLNAGQTCTALTRLLVPASRQDEAIEIAAERAATFVPADPLEASTKLGPLVSGPQRDRVVGYVRRGIEEGARLVAGGDERPTDLDRGHFVPATVFADVAPDATIAQEEIFGPVLSILPYRDEEDAAAIANDSSYGLSGAVWSEDQDHAVAFARRLRTGQVAINGGPFDPTAPFGGFKRSGLGREHGRYGLEEFLEVKALLLPPD